MWQGNKLSASRPWFAGIAASVIGLVVGCSGDIGGMLDGRPGAAGSAGGSAGSAGSAGAAGNQMPGTGAGGADSGGAPGGNGLPPCTGTADPRLVVAPQRLVKLTRLQIINTIGVLINATLANQIAADPNFSDVSDETGFRSPPLVSHGEAATISGDPNSQPQLDLIAQTAAQYVHDNFATVTGCATATDNCATAWLTSKAPAIYRRPVTTAEQTRISGLYTKLKAQTVNGFNITATVEEATQYAVYGFLSAPEFLWRSEIGDATKASTSPPGIPLTDYELASLLSYFLTNGPPDAGLLNDAKAGTLRTNIATQADRLLATQGSKTWLTTMMFTAYRLNLLYNERADPMVFPVLAGSTLADMHDEAKMFLDNSMWNGNLTDILLSRTTFLNTNLAMNIYQVPVPAGATATNFVKATLPSDQRAGLLTNAAYITSRAGADRESVVQRALLIKDTLLCLKTNPPPEAVLAAVAAAKMAFDTQTAQEQVAFRASHEPCHSCHGNFDMYGLVLDGYDNVGRTRTNVSLSDGMGGTVMKPVDSHTALPPSFGGAPVSNAVDMAQKLAALDSFASCQATTILQNAMAEFDTSAVEMPTPGDVSPAAAGCASLDVAGRYTKASGKTFADMVRASVQSPAFFLRSTSM